MNARELVKKLVDEGMKQVEIARTAGISQGTVYKLLHTESKPTLDIVYKLSRAFSTDLDIPAIAEAVSNYGQREKLTPGELRLLDAFRALDNQRQARAIETLEDMALAFKERVGGSPPTRNRA